MSTNYLELIRRGAKAHGSKTAVVFGAESLTFEQVHRRSNQLANALRQHGETHGKLIAVLLNNGLHSVPLDFALVKAGANRVPLNARLSVEEHQRMLTETGCERLIYGADLAERARELRERLPNLRCYGLDADACGGGDLLAQAATCSTDAPDVVVTDDDVVLTLFTSGTTGTLKAAQHTQASFAAVCKNVLMNMLNVQPEDRMLHAASLIHASGVFILPFWLRGACTVIMSHFEPDEYLRLIERERITAINLVPTMLQMLMEHPRFADCDIRHLRQVIYGASPMPRAVIEKAMALWGRERFWQYYGQTECPLCIAVLRPEDHQGTSLGACGRPAVDVEIRLVDEQDNDVATGEAGEIILRAPSRMAGYFNAPALNKETFLNDGWLRTRDVAAFDERGYLHIRDRTSDMIITGGYNVYPRELEDLLMAHPAVAECAVIGLKHDKWVEAVTAVVALRAGEQVSEQALIESVAKNLASYKKPRSVIFVDSIPKTAVGKINRKALRDRFKSE